jgi:hypothetical protein
MALVVAPALTGVVAVGLARNDIVIPLAPEMTRVVVVADVVVAVALAVTEFAALLELTGVVAGRFFFGCVVVVVVAGCLFFACAVTMLADSPLERLAPPG